MQDVIAFDETIKYLNSSNTNINISTEAIGIVDQSLSNTITNINNTYNLINNSYKLVASDNPLIVINNSTITNPTSLSKSYVFKRDGSIRLVLKSWKTVSNKYSVKIKATIKKNGTIIKDNLESKGLYDDQIYNEWTYSNIINISNGDNITIDFTFSNVYRNQYVADLIPAFAYIGGDIIPYHSNLFTTWPSPSSTNYNYL